MNSFEKEVEYAIYKKSDNTVMCYGNKESIVLFYAGRPISIDWSLYRISTLEKPKDSMAGWHFIISGKNLVEYKGMYYVRQTFEFYNRSQEQICSYFRNSINGLKGLLDRENINEEQKKAIAVVTELNNRLLNEAKDKTLEIPLDKF